MSDYILTIDADLDIENLYQFGIDRWGAREAERYLYGLYDTFDLISQTPGVGRDRSDLREGLLGFPHRSHTILFVIRKEQVAIVRVLHGAADLEKLFQAYDPLVALPD